MTDVIARGVLEVDGDMTGFNAAVAEATTNAKQFETVVTQSTGRGAAALTASAKTMAAELDKLEPAQRRVAQAAVLAAAKAEMSAGSWRLYSAALKGLKTEGLEPYAALLDRAAVKSTDDFAKKLGMVGISAGQAANGMRMLPAQITDIVTGLASGQSAFTVLIQQGGQLRDSFGGIGNTLRAVASVFTPFRIAVGGAVAVLGGLALAYKEGADEAAEFRKQLALTGNAAGQTVSSLTAVAAAVGAVVGGQAAASDALAQYIATGQRAGAGLNSIAEAAIRLERVGGPAIKDTVKAFAELAKDPLGASIKLNESTNFLTLSVYKQIKALDEQGEKTEAAALAQREFAQASISRGKEIEQGLGSIERGWLAIKDAITGAKNALLDIGRPADRSRLLQEAEAQLAKLQRERVRGRNSGLQDDAERKLQQRIDEMRLAIYQEGEMAAAAEARASSVKAAIAADKDATKAIKDHDAALEASREAAKSWADAITDAQKIQADLAAETDGLTKSQKRLVEYLSSPAYLRNSDAMRQAAVQALAMAHNDEVAAKAKKDLAKAMDEITKAAIANADALAKGIESQTETNGGIQAQIDGLTLSKAAILDKKTAQLELTAAIYEQAAAQAMLDGLSASEAQAYQQRADLIREEIFLRRQLFGAEAQEEAADEAARAWKSTADDIRGALTDAFRRAFESGDDFGTAFAKTLGNEIKTRVAAALAGQVLALAFGANGGGAGGGSGYGNTLQGINAAGTLYQAYNGQGIIGGAAGYLASTNYAYGAAIGTTNVGAGSQAAMLAAQTGEFGTAGTVATSQAAAGAGSGAASWASVAGWVAAAVLGAMKASSDYSEGFNSSGSRQVSKDTGVYAFGGYEADRSNFFKKLGMGDRLADILSGSTAVAKLFGRAAPRIEAAGVSGTIGNGDFSGNLYADVVEKGGLFRSDKRYTNFAALPEELGRFLDAASQSVLTKAKDFGAALGLPATQLADVTKEVKVALVSPKDDTAAAIAEAQDANMKALAEVLGGYGDALVAGYAEAVRPLANYGETTAQTIQRVGESISGVNDVLDALGMTALQASIDGGKAAIALQSAFGDLSTLQQAAGGFLQNYYSDSERNNLTRGSIGKSLSTVGLDVPATREDFRARVEAQDLTTESGRKAFAVLMGVADAFASITEAGRSAADILNERQDLERQLLEAQGNTAALRDMERNALDESNRALYDQINALNDQKAAADAAKDAAESLASSWRSMAADALSGVSSAYADVASQISGEKDRINSEADKQLQALEQQAASVQSAFGGLIDSLSSALAQITGTNMSAASSIGSARGVLSAALAGMRSGRSVDREAVKDAAQALTRNTTAGYATRADFAAAQASNAQLLRDIQSLSRSQMTSALGQIAKQQVDIEAERDKQLDALDKQLDEAKKSAGVLVSIDSGVHSVADAIAALAQAVAMAQAIGGTPMTAQGQWLNGPNGAQVWYSAAGAIGTRQAGAGLQDTMIRGLSGSTFSAAAARDWVNGRITAGDFSGIVIRAISEGISSSDLDAIMGVPAGTAAEEARRRGLPSFAVGSSFIPHDMVAQVHAGERIIPAADNAALMRSMDRNADDSALLRELIEEVKTLRAENRAGHRATAIQAAGTKNAVEEIVYGEAPITTKAAA